VAAVASDRWLVVVFARLEAGVLEGMRYVPRWRFRCVVPVDAPIRVARILRRLVPVVRRMPVVRIVVRRGVWPVIVRSAIVRLVAVIVRLVVVGTIWFVVPSMTTSAVRTLRHEPPPDHEESIISLAEIIQVFEFSESLERTRVRMGLRPRYLKRMLGAP
jgi:hypothetical protein